MSPPPPVRPIARGIAGPGLIAQILVAKFGDHLPLYRQEDFFTRHGLHIPRSTLCDWVQAAAELLRPLYERQKELVLQSPVLWTDDTPVTVLTGSPQGSRQGRFWAYIGEKYPYTVYDFTESRARDGPADEPGWRHLGCKTAHELSVPVRRCEGSQGGLVQPD